MCLFGTECLQGPGGTETSVNGRRREREERRGNVEKMGIREKGRRYPSRRRRRGLSLKGTGYPGNRPGQQIYFYSRTNDDRPKYIDNTKV